MNAGREMLVCVLREGADVLIMRIDKRVLCLQMAIADFNMAILVVAVMISFKLFVHVTPELLNMSTLLIYDRLLHSTHKLFTQAPLATHDAPRVHDKVLDLQTATTFTHTVHEIFNKATLCIDYVIRESPDNFILRVSNVVYSQIVIHSAPKVLPKVSRSTWPPVLVINSNIKSLRRKFFMQVTREKVLEILNKALPRIDFTASNTLVDDGILDSLSVFTIVSELSFEYDINFDFASLGAANMNSLDSIVKTVQDLVDKRGA